MAPARKAMTEEITISFQDMETFLEPEEYQRFLRMKEEVEEYNKKIAEHEKKKAGAKWLPAPYIPIYYFQEHDRYIELVRERKLKQFEKEARKQERLVALQEINPPLDAEKNLSEEEYQRFLDGIPGAIDSYLDGGKGCILNDWRFDRRASSYIGLTGIIKDRKEKEARKKQAQLEYDQFLKEIKDTTEKLKQELAKEKNPKFAYPPWLAGYQPNLWCELPLPTKQRIEDWVKPQIQQKVPLVLRNFISWEVSWQVQTSPDAKYEVLGVPCLTWCFMVLVLVTVHLRLIEMKSTRKFQGYAYEIEVRADDLGSFHLGPALGGHQDGFSTPIALLSLLAKGEMEGPGIEVTNHGSPFTKFAIQGFEEETVEVHDAFRRFIKDIAKEQPLAQALLDKGLTGKDTAKLIEAKWDKPLPVSGELGDAEGSDLESVVAKLVEVGWTQADAKDTVETIIFPKNATTEEMVTIILQKSY